MSDGSRALKLAVLALATFLQIGCQAQKPKGEDPAIDELRGKIKSLETKLDGIRVRVHTIESHSSRYSSVSLDPTEKGYGRIDSNSGFFFVSVHKAEPYLDGFRLVLAIGNPSGVSYNGFKLKVAWSKDLPQTTEGESSEEYEKKFNQYEASNKEKEYSFIETLHPGSWNTITLIISPASAEELKNATVESLETDQISLVKR
jgi:hypothetical protein